MAKLIEAYSRNTGLEIDKPFLMESFYPIGCEKYITIQNGSGMPNAKNYDYWQEVVDQIYPVLESNKIKIILLGSSEDSPLNKVIDLRGKTNMHQSNFIIKRSLLHIGNDSCLAHIAGANNIPLVCLYGSTTVANHSPYHYNKDKTIFIESHRCGNRPTFQAQENPKTINFIQPEKVVDSIYHILDIKESSNSETIYIGNNYQKTIVEYVPNCDFNVNLTDGVPLIVRMDYHFDPNKLIPLAQRNIKFHLIIKQLIDINFLKQLKNFISNISIEVSDDLTTDYLKNLKNLGFGYVLFLNSDSNQNLNDLRLKFFDYGAIEKLENFSLEDFQKKVRIYLNNPDFVVNLDKLMFRSQKTIFANNKIYSSKIHFLKDSNISSVGENCGVIDDRLFWEDFEHFYFTEIN